jgi:hypothetical protein
VPHLRPAGRRPPALSFSVVARSGEERGGEKNRNDARVSGERPARGFVQARTTLSRRSQMNGSHTVGLNEAQAGGEKAGPSLRCFNFRAAGWVTGRFLFLAGLELVVWARFGPGGRRENRPKPLLL